MLSLASERPGFEVRAISGRTGRSQRENDAVAICVELRDEAGRTVTGLRDPSGGTFDAAGDFDRFIDQAPYGQVSDGLPVLESIDPFGTTVMPSGSWPA